MVAALMQREESIRRSSGESKPEGRLLSVEPSISLSLAWHQLQIKMKMHFTSLLLLFAFLPITFAVISIAIPAVTVS